MKVRGWIPHQCSDLQPTLAADLGVSQGFVFFCFVFFCLIQKTPSSPNLLLGWTSLIPPAPFTVALIQKSFWLTRRHVI